MCAKMLNKMMGFLGLEDETDLEVNEDMGKEESNESETVFPINSKRNNQNKVVNIHTATSAKIVIFKPRDFDEATSICEGLKNRKIVVVNTTALEIRIAQKLLDFVGGVCCALSAEIQEIEKGVYILTPSNVEVTTDLKNELTSKGILSWNR